MHKEGQPIQVDVKKRESGVALVNDGVEPIRGRDGIQGEKVHDRREQIFALIEGKNGLAVSREIARRIQKALGEELDVEVRNLIERKRPESQINTVVNHGFQRALREAKQIEESFGKKELDMPAIVKIVVLSDQEGIKHRMYFHGENIFVIKKSGLIDRLPTRDARGKMVGEQLIYQNMRDLLPGDRVVLVNKGVESRLMPAELLEQIRVRPGNDQLAEKYTQECADDKSGQYRHERTREMSVVVFTIPEIELKPAVVRDPVRELARMPERNKFNPIGNEMKRLQLQMEIASLKYWNATNEVDKKRAQEEYHRLKQGADALNRSQYQKQSTGI